MAKRDELKRHLKYWQPRLRLNDWQITIRFARESEEEMLDCQGRCDWDMNVKTAAIRVLDPRDYDPSKFIPIAPQDMELVVVHELLHLHFAGWNPRNKAEEVMIEQAIEAISASLLSLKRRKRS